MATNFKHEGETLKVTAPAAVSSGDVIKINNLVGICLTDAESGATVELAITKAWSDLPKATGESWSQGETVYWDNSAENFTTTATSNTEAGVADADAGSADATGDVLLGVYTQPGS